MQMRTLWLPIILILVGLTGCGEVKEKASDQKVLLNEKENELPKSVLQQYDKENDKKILLELPQQYSKLLYTYDNLSIKDISKNIIIKKIVFKNNDMYIHVKVNGSNSAKIHLLKETCTQIGFWSCGGYSNMLYYVEDLKHNQHYDLQRVENVEFDIKKFSDDTKKKINKSTFLVYNKNSVVEFIKLSMLKNKNLTFVFTNIKYLPLRYFTLKEGYSGDWHFGNIRLGLSKEELENIKDIKKYLSTFKLNTISINKLNSIYKKYDKYIDIQNIIAKNILERTLQKNSIEELHKFNHDFSIHKNLVNTSIKKIYELIKIKDSVAGYEWFIKKYSKSKFSKYALARIHEIMFQKSKIVDTISAYNSFIYSYPTAKQVDEANRLASEKEKKIYTDLGVISFWDTDHKKDKKSRQLLIKAKQIERFPRDNNLRGNRAAGYFIVANRMYQLLQEEFNDSDATLRYLESQEFKDFIKDFKNIMSDIKYTLEKINKNTSDTGYYVKELINVSQKGFDDAKTDRAMAAYHAKKHTEWEKRMHFQDKGYQ